MIFDPALVYDVGLHKGEDTEFYLKKGFKVVSFEADPDLATHCRTRFADQIMCGNLHVVEGAVAPERYGDRIAFYRSAVSIWGTIKSDWALRNLKGTGTSNSLIEINRVNLLEAFRTFGIPFYMKIDIEGADKYVLDSLKLLTRPPQFVSIESEKVEFSALTREMKMLHDIGYTKFKIVQQELIPGATAKFSDIHGIPFEHTFPRDASGPFGDDIPQVWVSFDEAIQHYKRIFRLYRFFGDGSPAQKLRIARLTSKVGRIIGRPLPGWYDTHASL